VRAWARDLDRFAERFWVTTPSGRFPAIALDREGRAVDTLTSNIGHLLGTGILDRAQEASVPTC
jgi:glycogen debranching enzyme